MLDKVESDAPDDGHFVGGHGTKQLFDRHFFVCNFGGGVEDVVVGNLYYFGLESCLFCCCTDVKVWRGQDWLTPQFAAVGCDEANESVPAWCHDVEV